MVEGVELVVSGGFLLVAGIAIVLNPTLGEFNVGNRKAERALGVFFGILGILFGTALVYVDI